ncbi:MAG TPA: chromosomal replication initiator protein DnaA [Candidatus Paceibacterota bacterium]|nr:chromosomal replication initiator protein DnaA [Candidatus Paceibacterota bacterium]
MTSATPEELWKAVLGEMEVSLSRAHFTTWFKNTTIVSRDQNSVTVSVPNGFVKEWLENKFSKQILVSIRKLSNEVREVKYIVGQPKPEPLRYETISKAIVEREFQEQTTSDQSQEIDRTTYLNKKYSFESFVVGSANEVAFACAQGVASNLGRLHNPLFICGGVGLGKTHLIQSVGNTVLTQNPERKVLYTTGEKLTATIVEALRNRTIEEVKNLYSRLDLLIIDDIQYIAGKDKTQEIVFTIFNELYNRNKQVVITSDRPPKAIPAIEERLQSRLMGGMIADIGAPDYETRLAILKTKAAERGAELDDEVLAYIATHIQKNIRELEGALNRIVALAQIYNRTPELKEVKNLLNAYLSVPYRKTSPQAVLKTVADFYNISPLDLTKRSRKKEVVKPRQVAMYLLREEIKLSFPEIGIKLGGRDHSTVIHACDKIKREEQVDEPLKNELTLIRQRIYDSFEH